eukprot:3712333-Pleurochrysis_carterae.AAC.2
MAAPDKSKRARRDRDAAPSTESRRFGRQRWLRWNPGCANPDGGSRRPRKASFIKVDVVGHNQTETGHENVARAGRTGVASEVDTDPGARVHARFEHGWFRFDSERLSTKWHDTHDGGLFASDDFKRRLRAAWRRRRAV